MALTEAQAQELEDRGHLMPAWSRDIIGESRIEVERDIEARAEEELSVKFEVPTHCDRTSEACAITIHAQADIRGQIDPTATGRLQVA
jgi:hypothetical protein